MGLRFVVLEHSWDGIHYDFMLEREGVLKTWAIDAWPTPGLDLPARRLPDHRIAYLDYEGPVSGDRGNVLRLSFGFYETVAWERDRVSVRLEGDQLVGAVEIRLLASDAAGAETWILRLGNFD